MHCKESAHGSVWLALQSLHHGEFSGNLSVGQRCVLCGCLFDMLRLGHSTVQVSTGTSLVSPCTKKEKKEAPRPYFWCKAVVSKEKVAGKKIKKRCMLKRRLSDSSPLLRWLPQVSPDKLVHLMSLLANADCLRGLSRDWSLAHNSDRLFQGFQASSVLVHELVLRQDGLGRPKQSGSGG